eukprot:7423938-Pyramimonas_sp.AAC.1
MRPHPVNAPVPPQFLEQALWMLHELAADRTTAFPLFDWLRSQEVLATQVQAVTARPKTLRSPRMASM